MFVNRPDVKNIPTYAPVDGLTMKLEIGNNTFIRTGYFSSYKILHKSSIVESTEGDY